MQDEVKKTMAVLDNIANQAAKASRMSSQKDDDEF